MLPGGGDEQAWHDAAAIRGVQAAIWERGIIINAGDGDPGQPDAIAVGEDVQAAAFWAGLQGQVAGLYPNYVNPSASFVGRVLSPYEALSTNDVLWRGIAEGFAAAGLPGWTRKRPREIASLDAFTDVQGNVAQLGHVAYYEVKEGFTPREYGDGVVYRWSGTVWEPQPGPIADANRPDVVYTDRAKFRTIAATNAIADRDGQPAQVGHRALLTNDAPFYARGSIVRVAVREADGWTITEDPSVSPDVLIGEAGVERTISGPTATVDGQGRPAQGCARAPDGTVYCWRPRWDGDNADYYRDPDTDEYVYEWGQYDPDFYPPDNSRDDEYQPDRVTSQPNGILCGPMQPGDYIGAWVIDDLATMIRTLGNRTLAAPNSGAAYLLYTGSTSHGIRTENNVPETHDVVYRAATWSEALDYYRQDWGQHGTQSFFGWSAYASGSHTFADPEGPSTPGWSASAFLASSKAWVTTSPHRTRTVQLYAIFRAAGRGYDALGVGGAEDALAAFGQAFVIAKGTAGSAHFDPLSPSTAPPTPEQPEEEGFDRRRLRHRAELRDGELGVRRDIAANLPVPCEGGLDSYGGHRGKS